MSRPTSNRGPWTVIDGKVQRLGDNGFFFREEDADHDIFLPFSQVRDADYVEVGDDAVEVTDWLLGRLAEEGKR
jgi:hypothetical protein